MISLAVRIKCNRNAEFAVRFKCDRNAVFVFYIYATIFCRKKKKP